MGSWETRPDVHDGPYFRALPLLKIHLTRLTTMLRKALDVLAVVLPALAATGTQEYDVLLEDMVEKVISPPQR